MRLKDLVDELKKGYIFEYEIVGDTNVASKAWIKNYRETMIYLSNIRAFEFIKQDIDELEEKSGLIFNSRTKELIIERLYAKNFEQKMLIIKAKIDTIFCIAENYVKTECDTDINIRIPNNGLADISNVFKTIDQAIGQIIINDTLNGKVEVKKFETGSLWIGIGLGSIAAISFVGECLWTAEAIRKKHYEAEASRLYIQAVKSQNEDLEKARKIFLDVIDKEVNGDYEKESKKLIKSHHLENEGNEYSEKLKFALKAFNELMEKGVEFKPNALAPEEVKNLFPKNDVFQKLLDVKKDEDK